MIFDASAGGKIVQKQLNWTIDVLKAHPPAGSLRNKQNKSKMNNLLPIFYAFINLINILLARIRTRDEEDEEYRRRAQRRDRDYQRRLAFFLERRRRRRRVFFHRLRLQNRRRIWAQPELLRNDAFASNWELHAPHYSDERFVDKFRVSRQTFNLVVEAVRPYIARRDTVLRRCIPVEKRVAVALFVLKSNSDFWTVADWFRIGKSTVPYILYEFCDVVNTVLFDRYVVYPHTDEEKRAAANDFYLRWQFPDTFGALDGTHIPILEPPLNAPDYFNYKRYHSIVLMALVNANYIFTYVNIGTPGRVNDESIYNRSALKRNLSNMQNNDMHIIGDGAFPLSMSLMKPYPITPNMPQTHRNFNRRLSRARVVVEDAFGRLKGRWRILMKRGDLSVDNTNKIIKTCVVLHNICESQKDPYLPIWGEEVQQFGALYPQPEGNLNQRAILAIAQLKRDTLATALQNDDVDLLIEE